MIYWRTVLLFTLAPWLLYIIKHSSNVSLMRARFRYPATFQTKCLVTKGIIFQQLIVAWKSSILDLEDFRIKFNVIAIQYPCQTFSKYFCFRENKKWIFLWYLINALKRIQIWRLVLFGNRVLAHTSRKQWGCRTLCSVTNLKALDNYL